MTAAPSTEKKAYKDTLNLPKTSFPMRAGAQTREPALQAFWAQVNAYEQAVGRRKQAWQAADNDPDLKFVLHDGPPYLSSDKIHIGTALNKVLKDIVTRYQTLKGRYSPYVPGYDGHGLPIEAAVEKKLKGGRASVSETELRQLCRDFAKINLSGQETNFKRLGVWGNWDQPYLTIDGAYEAQQVRLFGTMMAKGYITKGLKPIYWDPIYETALAEAEVEYHDHESHSIYVAFDVVAPTEKRFGAPLTAEQAAHLDGAKFIIWTTTPWTLSSNVAMAVHPEFTYQVVQTQAWGKVVVVDALRASLLETLGEAVDASILAELKGADLEGLQGHHPFVIEEAGQPRLSPILLADFVTTESGTGLVHIAPGHGPDDYIAVQTLNATKLVGQKPLPVLSPINSKGCFKDEGYIPEALKGQFYAKANPLVLDILREQQALLHHNTFTHSYPHSWRSHKPVIYRATPQWFVNLAEVREPALTAIKATQWIPARGESRIGTMVENRHEWCISRQRTWGVPIPIIYLNQDQTEYLEGETLTKAIEVIASVFEEETSDAWTQYDDAWWFEKLSEAGVKAPEGKAFTSRETDIMDVWFDSGVSHSAVVDARAEELSYTPVDLYLEGSDQHRGWFQSSLLTSVMTTDDHRAPYQAVLTHGFVLDEHGKKMSKSKGNVIDPNKVMDQVGADVLRLWVASVDYTSDVKIGQGTIKQLGDIYRKIRNTSRFLLGNLAGFNPETDSVPYAGLSDLDRYVLHRLQEVVAELTQAFDDYQFHKFYQVLQNFCTVELSSLYLDIVKDVLYCNAPNDPVRRGVQTVLQELLSVITRLVLPVMPHLAEDIWQHWGQLNDDVLDTRPVFSDSIPETIMLADWPTVTKHYQLPAERVAAFQLRLGLREQVNLALEDARKNGNIGGALDARVSINIHSAPWLTSVNQSDLLPMLLTSQLVFGYAEGTVLATQTVDDEQLGSFTIQVTQASGHRCDRCWKVDEAVGTFSEHPTLCTRCHEAIQ